MPASKPVYIIVRAVSGKDLNLWEILTAVNETVRKTPDSNMAKLIGKFEVRERNALTKLK